MLNSFGKERYDFNDLVELMHVLRHECPWDREQTHESIRMNFIEEAYEAADAIDRSDAELLCEELGDVLLQVVFHTCISAENGDFNMCDVTTGICKKLISRHPHIFGDVRAETPSEVLNNWEKIKLGEKGGEHRKTLEAVAKAMPSLMRAEKLVGRAAKAGLPLEVTGSGTPDSEIGRTLFETVIKARQLSVNPEQALSKACDKFLSDSTELLSGE